MIIAVDFDGTLCENKYPEIGEPNTSLIEKLIDKRKKGDKVILWTCREGIRLTKAVEWCYKEGLIFDAINANLPEAIGKWGNDPRKVGADVYIDDKAINML